MQQWHLLYKTRSYAEASIIQGMLAENFIPVQVMNKQDSSYLNFGDIEIHVPINLKDVAKSLLDKALLN
jgi:hypothetical protein